jgi:hypothetical protein
MGGVGTGFVAIGGLFITLGASTLRAHDTTTIIPP